MRRSHRHDAEPGRGLRRGRVRLRPSQLGRRGAGTGDVPGQDRPRVRHHAHHLRLWVRRAQG